MLAPGDAVGRTGGTGRAGVATGKAGPPVATKVGAAGTLRAITVFAAAVPSAPQAGHVTVHGIRPPTGSTSNAYR